MAGSASCKSLRKRRTKNFSLSSKSTAKQAKNCEYDTQSFAHYITDLESCRLVELEVNETGYCNICVKLKKKNIETRYSCNSCGIICCPECYDFHHKERMLHGLRALRVHCSENAEIRVSQDGEFAAAIRNPVLSAQFNNLGPTLDRLQKQFNAKIELKLALDNKLDCLYFQDKQMAQFFRYYPEYILFDVACEIVELELTLYLIICEDANGHCEIIAACLLKTEDDDNLLWMCEVFKENNPCWANVRVVLLDSQIQNIDIFQQAFPSAEMCFSCFHVMQSFRKELSNLEVKKKELTTALKLFESMILSSCETEYDKLHQEFCKLAAPLVLCFENTWHIRRNMWTLALKFRCTNFLSPMNKFLWQAKKRMKNALNTKNRIDKIISVFFATVFAFRKEHYQNLSNTFCAVKVSPSVRMLHNKYANFLTHYGGMLVIHQLDIVSDVKNIQKVSAGKYTIGGLINPVTVTTTCCSCNFNTFLSLPCSHIFAVRKLLSLPLFWETLCSARWIAKSYQSTFLALHSQFLREGDFQFDKDVIDNYFRGCFDVVSQLLPLLTQTSMEMSGQRCNILCHLLEAWKHNIKVNVKVIESPPDTNKELHLDPNCSIDHLKNLYGVSVEEQLHTDGEFSSVSLCSDDSDNELLKCIADDTPQTT